MLILLGLILVIIVGFILVINENMIGDIFMILGSICLFICIVFIAGNQVIIPAEIAKIEAIESTINNARRSDKIIESAAFQIKIAEANQKIARWQYYNNTVFDIFIPDEVETLELIE